MLIVRKKVRTAAILERVLPDATDQRKALHTGHIELDPQRRALLYGNADALAVDIQHRLSTRAARRLGLDQRAPTAQVGDAVHHVVYYVGALSPHRHGRQWGGDGRVRGGPLVAGAGRGDGQHHHEVGQG